MLQIWNQHVRSIVKAMKSSVRFVGRPLRQGPKRNCVHLLQRYAFLNVCTYLIYCLQRRYARISDWHCDSLPCELGINRHTFWQSCQVASIVIDVGCT